LFVIFAGMTDFNEFRLWKKDIIQQYLRIRGLPTTGNKDEIITLAFGVSCVCIELTYDAKDVIVEKGAANCIY